MTDVRLKHVAWINAGQSPPSERVEPYAGDLPFLQGNAEFGEESPEPRLQCPSPPKRASRGDILISVRAPVGALNVADQDYGIGRGLVAIRARAADQRFVWWWLHASVDRLESVATGSTYTAVTAEDLGNLTFADVAIDEQRRIADFLDAETRRLDALVDARIRQRALVELRKARLIESELGVDDLRLVKTVAMKHRVLAVTVGIVIRPSTWYVDGGGVPALRGVNVRPGLVVTEDLVEISHEGHALHRKSRLQEGDVVVVRTGQAGAAAVVPVKYDGANCIDLVIIRPGPNTVPRYLELLLNSDFARSRVEEHSVGSIQAHFNVGAMKMLPVPVISVEDQLAAVDRIERWTLPVDRLLTTVDRQIRVLSERRQALIAAAVTGEIDVTTAGRAVEWATTGR